MGAVSEIIEQLRQVARPGQAQLDGTTTDRLRVVTRSLIDAKPGAAAELARFLDVRNRGLCLPEADLAAKLGGATVLVTGGTGCIGSMLMRQLAARCPGRLVSVSRGLSAAGARVAGTEYRRADVRDRAALDAVVDEIRPDVIFHLAAQRDPGLAEIEVHRTIATNLLGTRNVLAAAVRFGVPHVVCASTGKALRPYSPETYTASKRAAEWAMAAAAAENGLICSAARFTHVVDNSIIYRRLRSWGGADPLLVLAQPASREGAPVIRLHSAELAFYIQSALESAQLLLTAFAGAAPGELRVFAITNLDIPVCLLDLALGVLRESGSAAPLYISGYDAGYEESPFPGLYDPMTAGDVSPLLNSFETASVTESPSPMADAFRLGFTADPRLLPALRALEAELSRTADPARLRAALSGLSWPLLDAALAAAPPCALERAAGQAGRHWDTMPDAHRRILTAIRATAVRSGQERSAHAA
jgi:nucleoside-diphosphate-sugar epimerase